jgi:biopolymer transport protein TolR
MASSEQRDSDDEMISGINVTPLVDVTLVLLIIFMVTATYIVRQSIDVNLPRAQNGGETVGQTLLIVIHADGTVFVDGAPMDDAALRERVRIAKDKDVDAKAILAADKDSRHGAVVHVIDVIKGAGIAKFALNIEKEDEVDVGVPGAQPPPPARRHHDDDDDDDDRSRSR